MAGNPPTPDSGERESDLLTRLAEAGCASIMWERLGSNGWWRAYAATRRDLFGTPEDEAGTTHMGGGPSREEALKQLLEAVKRGR